MVTTLKLSRTSTSPSSRLTPILLAGSGFSSFEDISLTSKGVFDSLHLDMSITLLRLFGPQIMVSAPAPLSELMNLLDELLLNILVLYN